MGIPLRAPDISMAQGAADQHEILRLAVEHRPKGVAERVDGRRSSDTSAAKPEGESVLHGARGERGRPLEETSAQICSLGQTCLE